MASALDDVPLRYDRSGNLVPIQPQPLPAPVQEEIENVRGAVRDAVPTIPPELRRQFQPALDPEGSGGVLQYEGGNLRSYQPPSSVVQDTAQPAIDYVRDRARALDATAPVPDDDYASVRPGYSPQVEFINRGSGGASEATKQILKDSAEGRNIPQDPAERATVLGAPVMPGPDEPSALGPPAGPAVTPPPAPGQKPQVTSSQTPQTAAGTATPPPPAPPKEEPKAKGGAGVPASATRGRGPDENPDVTPKLSINPRAYVELRDKDPALYDNITHVAATMGVGPWDLTNLVFAASGGDPNYDKDGRIGLTGLTRADVQRYQQEHPELFRDAQGNPVSATDPHTNLILGAMKYREVSDIYGVRTPSAIAAYYLGPGKVNQLATLTPKEQKDHMTDGERAQIRNTINPDAREGSAPATMALTSSGTTTPVGVAQAATAAAQAGNPQLFATYMANNLPRGMSSSDGWRHVEALGVYAMMRTGDIQGAQRVREMVFQMSHVGANTALMQAHQQLLAGDLNGAAHNLAKAYFYAPDGGYAKFYVTPQGIVGRRFNEATNQPVGAPFPITAESVQGMLNITQDPQTYLKTLQDTQKTNAEVESKKAHAEYYRGAERRALIAAGAAQTRAETHETGRLTAAALKPPPGGAAGDKVDPHTARADREVKRMFDIPDDSPEGAITRGLTHDMLRINPQVSPDRMKDIATDLARRGGRFTLQQGKSGMGQIVDAKTKQPIPVYLTPYGVQQYLGR